MKHDFLLPLVLALLWTASDFAHAHAFLDYSEPKVGGTVNAPPAMVRIWFTEGLNHTQSKISVFDAAGKEVDAKDSKVDSGNRSLMTVSLPKLPDGVYCVEWSAVAVDTHPTQGKFFFTIKKQ